MLGFWQSVEEREGIGYSGRKAEVEDEDQEEARLRRRRERQKRREEAKRVREEEEKERVEEAERKRVEMDAERKKEEEEREMKYEGKAKRDAEEEDISGLQKETENGDDEYRYKYKPEQEQKTETNDAKMEDVNGEKQVQKEEEIEDKRDDGEDRSDEEAKERQDAYDREMKREAEREREREEEEEKRRRDEEEHRKKKEMEEEERVEKERLLCEAEMARNLREKIAERETEEGFTEGNEDRKEGKIDVVVNGRGVERKNDMEEIRNNTEVETEKDNTKRDEEIPVFSPGGVTSHMNGDSHHVTSDGDSPSSDFNLIDSYIGSEKTVKVFGKSNVELNKVEKRDTRRRSQVRTPIRTSRSAGIRQ